MRIAILFCVLLVQGCGWNEKLNKTIIDRALAECVRNGYSAIRVTFILGMASNFRECVKPVAPSTKQKESGDE